jgi:hypothetical protein
MKKISALFIVLLSASVSFAQKKTIPVIQSQPAAINFLNIEVKKTNIVLSAIEVLVLIVVTGGGLHTHLPVKESFRHPMHNLNIRN